MRIALLSVSAEMGGSEASLLELVRGIARLEPTWKPVVVVPREGPLAARLREIDVEVRVLPIPAALASFGEWSARGPADLARKGAALMSAAGSVGSYQRALTSLLREIGPDVIHSNGFKLHVLGSRSAPEGVPVVWHIHEYVGRRPLSRALLRHHVGRASALVANSRSVGSDLLKALGPAAPVTSVYNAVDLDTFSPLGAVADLDALSDLAPPAAGTVRIGLVATFARWKGHETFLRAVQQLGDAPVRAYVIGGPVYDTAGSQHTLDELRTLAATLGLGGRVGFTGFVAQPAAAMRALDLVVHASTEPEPFGLVIAEGMACGRAVLVSAAGGAAELVEDDVDAIAFPPGDVAALAHAMRRVVTDVSLRARLGAMARRTALRRFDPDIFTREFLGLYRRVAVRGGTVTT